MIDIKPKNITQNKYNFTSFINETTTHGKHFTLNPDQILTFINQHNYSATKFKRNWRSKKNALNAGAIILDIDDVQINNRSIKDISESVKNLNHIIATTKSHQIPKNGKTCDRYRIIIFLSDPITNPLIYTKTIYDFCESIDLLFDKQAVDMGRFFYSSPSIFSWNFNGYTLSPSAVDQNVEAKLPKKFRYNQSEGPISECFVKWINIPTLGKRVIEAREKFVRLLIAQKHLVIRNPLPQEEISQFLNIKCDTLRSWLKEFRSRDWLELPSNDYGKGWKALDYIAKNELFYEIMNYHKFKNKWDSRLYKELPTQINDGEWHRTLFLCSFHFKSDPDESRYIKWVKSIQGWDKKTRLKEAHDTFKCMKKFESLKE